jgi:hypothetical protein
MKNMNVIIRSLVLFVCLCSAQAYAETVIRWAKGAPTTVCAVDSAGRGECEVAVTQLKNADLRAVVPVNLGLAHPAQWIEVR